MSQENDQENDQENHGKKTTDNMRSGRGVLLVLSSPSGAGKSSIVAHLREDDRTYCSISATTRLRRRNEVDGIDYHFVSVSRFEQMRQRGEFLEWAENHGNLYATPRDPVEEALAAGRDVIFDIDVNGTRQLCDAMPNEIVSIFILPPSIEELRSRLHRRAEDDEEVIKRRLINATAEMAHWREYDYVLINEDLDKSVAQARSILIAERQRQKRIPGIDSLVKQLLADLPQPPQP